MKSNQKSTLVWLQGLTCNGNSQSFFNYESFEVFKKSIKILHHPQIRTPYEMNEIIESNMQIDFLVVEGAFTKNDKYIDRFGYSFSYLVDELSKRAKHIICAGSCSSFGGIFRFQNEKEIFGALYSGKEKGGYWKKNEKVVNIPGCPMHPRWFVDTIYKLHRKDKLLLDEYKRPKDVYAFLVHHGCLRNEYFEWKVDCKDYGQKEGCLFYEHGCQGPMTHASCNKILWNSVSSKTRVGSPCLGCTEFDFPKKRLYETKTHMSLPPAPYGISKRAYYSLAGVAKGFKIDRLEKRLIDEDN
ncbi:hydrogenase [Sulfurospirillum sp. 1307]|jgi:hydrogenase small subunit